MPTPSARQAGRISLSIIRMISEYSICKSQIGWTAAARRTVAALTSDRPIART